MPFLLIQSMDKPRISFLSLAVELAVYSDRDQPRDESVKEMGHLLPLSGAGTLVPCRTPVVGFSGLAPKVLALRLAFGRPFFLRA